MVTQPRSTKVFNRPATHQPCIITGATHSAIVPRTDLWTSRRVRRNRWIDGTASAVGKANDLGRGKPGVNDVQYELLSPLRFQPKRTWDPKKRHGFLFQHTTICADLGGPVGTGPFGVDPVLDRGGWEADPVLVHEALVADWATSVHGDVHLSFRVETGDEAFAQRSARQGWSFSVDGRRVDQVVRLVSGRSMFHSSEKPFDLPKIPFASETTVLPGI